jgi:hypothetical protein
MVAFIAVAASALASINMAFSQTIRHNRALFTSLTSLVSSRAAMAAKQFAPITLEKPRKKGVLPVSPCRACYR